MRPVLIYDSNLIRWIFRFFFNVFSRIYSKTANSPPIIGPDIHVDTIWDNVLASVGLPVKRFHPIIAPTIACVVDTGIAILVIR